MAKKIVGDRSIRDSFVKKLRDSGVVVTKTGAARRNPVAMVSSRTAKKQLDAVTQIRRKKETA